jgi:hypothetical protein
MLDFLKERLRGLKSIFQHPSGRDEQHLFHINMKGNEMNQTGCCQSSKKKCLSNEERAVVAERAYYKWIEAGAPHGDSGEKFWLEAEQELTKAEVECVEIET